MTLGMSQRCLDFRISPTAFHCCLWACFCCFWACFCLCFCWNPLSTKGRKNKNRHPAVASKSETKHEIFSCATLHEHRQKHKHDNIIKTRYSNCCANHSALECTNYWHIFNGNKRIFQKISDFMFQNKFSPRKILYLSKFHFGDPPRRNEILWRSEEPSSIRRYASLCALWDFDLMALPRLWLLWLRTLLPKKNMKLPKNNLRGVRQLS